VEVRHDEGVAPTLLRRRKATWTDALPRASGQPGVVEEPGMCKSSLGGNREIPRPTCAKKRHWSASGRRGAVADDAWTLEVRLCRSVRWAAHESGGLKSLQRSDEGRCIQRQG
jgi:hypothetical protein